MGTNEIPMYSHRSTENSVKTGAADLIRGSFILLLTSYTVNKGRVFVVNEEKLSAFSEPENRHVIDIGNKKSDFVLQ